MTATIVSAWSKRPAGTPRPPPTGIASASFVRDHRQYYEPAVEERYLEDIERLDPTPVA
jgi:hypothetical protein